MNRLTATVAAMAILAITTAASGSELRCSGPEHVEEFRYSWRLRGGLRFIAGLILPTAGTGNLRTTYPVAGEHDVRSALLITAPGGRADGFYEYESQIDDRGAKTLMTYHGYEWGRKSRHERTVFDYVKGLARMWKQTPETVENRVKKLPPNSGELRDILTAIYFMRQNATSITLPMRTSVYSDGKEYPVIFRSAGHRTFVIDGRVTQALGFEIVDAPGGRKWQGGVKVWLSDDERRIPFRIEIQRSIASVQLDLQSVEACAFLAAGS